MDGPLDAALNPDLFRTTAAGPTLAPVEAVARLERARPDLVVTRFPLRTRPGPDHRGDRRGQGSVQGAGDRPDLPRPA
ncbi:MAG: hypothetical protein WDM92_02375 [Caulobacteraceae bacterium]